MIIPFNQNISRFSSNLIPQPEMSMNVSLTDLKVFLATAGSELSETQIIKTFALSNLETISCVLWNGIFHITGTDIVKIVTWRLEEFGRRVINQKKFEEGIFSDLRNLKAGEHACLEGPRSLFLECLFKNRAIRTQKKQKVFYFYSVPHDSLFLEVLERDLKRESSGIEATTSAFFPLSPRDTLEKARELCATIPGTFPTTDFRTLPTYLNNISNWSANSLNTPHLNTLSPLAQIDSPGLQTSSSSLLSSTFTNSLFDKTHATSAKTQTHKCALAGCSRVFQTHNALLKHAKKHLQNRIPLPFSPKPQNSILNNSPLPQYLTTPTLTAMNSPFMFDGQFNYGIGMDFLGMNSSIGTGFNDFLGTHSPLMNAYDTGMTPMLNNMGFGELNMSMGGDFGVDVFDLKTERGVFDLQELFKMNAPTEEMNPLFNELEYSQMNSLF